MVMIAYVVVRHIGSIVPRLVSLTTWASLYPDKNIDLKGASWQPKLGGQGVVWCCSVLLLVMVPVAQPHAAGAQRTKQIAHRDICLNGLLLGYGAHHCRNCIQTSNQYSSQHLHCTMQHHLSTAS